MQEEINKNTRTPNSIEQFIIERFIKNTYRNYVEVFILFLIIGLALSYLTYISFGEGFVGFLLILILDLTVIIFLFTISSFLSDIKKIIKSKDISSYKINSAQGEWSIEFEGTTVKTRYPVSKVSGDKIAIIFPETGNFPKYNEKQKIEYEYIKLFESPPPFGYNKIFISIDDKKFNERHEDYMKRLKPIGILSFVASISFCVILFFCFATKFQSTWILYLCLSLFLIFSRTIFIWLNNNKLRKKTK